MNSSALDKNNTDLVLEVTDLVTTFLIESSGPNFAAAKTTEVPAVDHVSFTLKKGHTLGMVGESGCGKSVTSLSILRLIQSPGRIKSGKIVFKGQSILDLSDEKMRKIRGREIAMIFQEPMTALNPVYTIGNQIEEVLRLHFPELSKKESKSKTLELLKKVGIPAPEDRYNDYPHQLSGGMRQRIMIAMAISCDPTLLIADEPTTALDVTIQAQILDLIRKLKSESQASVILITHDMGVVAEMCDEVAIMYAGQIIEYGTVQDIFSNPRHPYTRGLLDSVPHFEHGEKLAQLKTIPGMVPSLTGVNRSACRFLDRCERRQRRCEVEAPALAREVSGKGSAFACFYPLPVIEGGQQ